MPDPAAVPPRAVFFDIEGTLLHDGACLEGAAEAVSAVRGAGLAVRFLTNITARLPAAIARALTDHGIEAHAGEVLTAASACAASLRRRPGCRVHLLVDHAVEPLFEGLPRDDHAPHVVVLGDIGARFTFAALDQAFQMLQRGAELWALSRNPFWFNDGRRQLDVGAFVAALEAAAGCTAIVCGKPTIPFFQAALDSVALAPDEVLMVGDDISTDVAGAANAGLACCLVGTGKCTPAHMAQAQTQGVTVLPSVAALPDFLRQGFPALDRPRQFH
ncbi:HAD-IIA family hydrolase [Megalodesulfovibrio gigas]|uniref:Putative HAD superfamily hydrolase n=1 Tax=Megalodesulfovibrio gigas (strain ATCC 19364 / DSM 1382 / NCIMB 9332 / VKM B-1759) TaxID=1121448 RepID=T2G964_MEGG1|nr:HAD-IIA family hydrolase [Megalodesulfovibrio gigas]AGW12714.1 putative HAD superfamily hydrolase [Megalodesulfovibrio gigas DSM 1382 = ATCC 19364]